jgi:hypothetical protein
VNQELFSFGTEAGLRHRRPNFLCIGQPHAGAAWVREQLSAHPLVRLPRRCGDYFAFNYHRGERWYLARFGDGPAGEDIRHVGEVAPMYLYSDLAPSRIAAFRSIRKFIVTLRDPVSWLAARYAAIRQVSRRASDRAWFLEHHGHEFDRLCVHSFLMLYLALFDRGCFLFVTNDEAMANAGAARRRLADFLNIDADRFGEAPCPLPYPFPVLARILHRKAETPAWLFEELRARRMLVNEQTERLGMAIGRDISGWLID